MFDDDLLVTLLTAPIIAALACFAIPVFELQQENAGQVAVMGEVLNIAGVLMNEAEEGRHLNSVTTFTPDALAGDFGTAHVSHLRTANGTTVTAQPNNLGGLCIYGSSPYSGNELIIFDSLAGGIIKDEPPVACSDGAGNLKLPKPVTNDIVPVTP